MTQKENILEELKQLNSSLAGQPQNVYSVPADYFDGLITQVIARIKALEAADAGEELAHLSPLLHGISKQLPYSVPSNYFEGLAENVSAVVHQNDLTVQEELGNISPFLSSLKKEVPFIVPEGYFEHLTPGIIIEEKKAGVKIISLTNRTWYRIAAAALIIGLFVLAGLFYFNGNKEPGGKALAKFTRDVKKMNDVQKQDLIEFIDPEPKAIDVVQVNTAEVKTLLQGISEEELSSFQEQTEDIGDVLMTN